MHGSQHTALAPAAGGNAPSQRGPAASAERGAQWLMMIDLRPAYRHPARGRSSLTGRYVAELNR